MFHRFPHLPATSQRHLSHGLLFPAARSAAAPAAAQTFEEAATLEGPGNFSGKMMVVMRKYPLVMSK